MAKRNIIREYGEVFDSPYEKLFYEYLTGKGIKFELHKKMSLVEESEHGKAIDWVVDFYLVNLDIYIDIKGLTKTIEYDKLKKRLFQEKYGDKVYFIAEAPKWYQKEFRECWVEYEVKNKIESQVRAFKKKNEITRINDKIDLSQLIEKIKEKGLMPFDKV